MDVRVHRDILDKKDLLERFNLLHAVLNCYRRLLSYKICIWTKISSVATPNRVEIVEALDPNVLTLN